MSAEACEAPPSVAQGRGTIEEHYDQGNQPEQTPAERPGREVLAVSPSLASRAKAQMTSHTIKEMYQVQFIGYARDIFVEEKLTTPCSEQEYEFFRTDRRHTREEKDGEIKWHGDRYSYGRTTYRSAGLRHSSRT